MSAVFFRHRRVVGYVLGFGISLHAASAWAIPSPDLVVSLFASAAQVLGLLTVLVGGIFYTKRSRKAQPVSSTTRWFYRGIVVLLLVSVSANLLQHLKQADERNQRLHTNLVRSSTENGQAVGDVNLKTLSFSDQVDHPLGLSTDELAHWIASGEQLNLIDVREPEEVEMGRIDGAWHRRYPDLQANPIGLTESGSRTVLLCYSGNRSSELCKAFSQQGQECRFLVGGYEKWIAEGRELGLAGARSPEDLRQLPDFSNRDVLLDTPEVTELILNSDATFVDVRYPGEFDKGHLPNAINIPVRMLTSEELDEKLRALPDKPVIAPGYDKRSSFYGSILGLRLHRLGREFLGRYTVPHEYLAPRGEKPHVAAWRSANMNQGLMGVAIAAMSKGLAKLEDVTGSPVFAIVLMVLVLRILVSPLTIKADRDQRIQQLTKDRVDLLKAKYKDDKQKLSAEIMRRNRKYGITPFWNLTGSILQISLFLLAFAAVNSFSGEIDSALLWLPALNAPDSMYILPILISLVVFFHLRASSLKRSRQTCFFQLACSLLLFALTYGLSAGANLYLLTSVSLLWIQGYGVRSWLEKARLRKSSDSTVQGTPANEKARPLVVPLKLAATVPDTGNKAVRLGRMLLANLPVPNGFATTEALYAGAGSGDLPRSAVRELEQAWHQSGVKNVAVRSSGLNEDGADKSYAGMFDSILNVDRSSFLDAIKTVRASLSSQRASIYTDFEEERGGIIVQEMVDADYAGVLFTEHPRCTGMSLVEVVKGLGDDLVSGRVTPDTYEFGRVSRNLLSNSAPPFDLSPLLELGQQAEDLFGQPQDLEWAFKDGRFFLLQSRDITANADQLEGDEASMEAERLRLLKLTTRERGSDFVLKRTELSELLPQPTPLSFSLMESLWEDGGSTDLACRALGIPYEVTRGSEPYLVSVFGSLYVNVRERAKRTRRGTGAIASFRLARASRTMKEHFLNTFLPEFEQSQNLRDAVDFSRMSRENLVALFRCWLNEFVTEVYVEAEIINIAAEFYLSSAVKSLEKRGENPALYFSEATSSVVHRAMEMLSEIRTGQRPMEDFVSLFGHRAAHDYELSEPRYQESELLLAELLARATETPKRSSAKPSVQTLDKLLQASVDTAREYQILKEEAKHHCMRMLASIRGLLLELGKETELNEDIFYLTKREICRLASDDYIEDARVMAQAGASRAACWKAMSLPKVLTIEDLECLGKDNLQPKRNAPGELHGLAVAGNQSVVAKARVIQDPKEIDQFQIGEILVAEFTDPTWTPLFPRAAGIVTEVGGWLSHAAIVAREFQVTTVVGVEGAVGGLKTGDLIRLHTDGSVTHENEHRQHTRTRVTREISMAYGDTYILGHLEDLSVSGALVVLSAPLPEGERQASVSTSGMGERPVEIVRRTGTEHYGVRFLTPLSEEALDTLLAEREETTRQKVAACN